MPIIKPYDTGWNQYKSFLFDINLDVVAYNLAYMIDNAILWLVIIKCAIKIIFGILTMLHAIIKVGVHLIMWMIWESPFWIMTKMFESACNKMPAKGSKQQVEPKMNMKYKRRRNSGGEATALYFRWKRNFYKFQHNHCNGRQRKKLIANRDISRRRRKRPSKKKQNKLKLKKRIVSNQSRTKKHKLYNHE